MARGRCLTLLMGVGFERLREGSNDIIVLERIKTARKEKPWRVPSLLLEADLPAHTRACEVIGPLLAPPVLKTLWGEFEREATRLVDRLVALGSFDAVPELAE